MARAVATPGDVSYLDSSNNVSGRGLLGEGVDEIERQLPEEELAHERAAFPLLLASLLGDLAGLLLGGHPGFGGTHANPPGVIINGVDTHPATQLREVVPEV